MSRRLLLSGMAVLLVSAVLAAGDPAPVCLDVNATDFPAASLVDFGATRDRPTGRHGALFTGTDGRFYFEDGTRARFWGINVAKTSVFVPREVIDQAIEAMSRAGFNMVRFHHLDDVEGLLPPETAGTAQRIDAARLAILDYWIAELGKRGMYVYLDLLDYRTFSDREEVRNGPALGRGAKPYALFDQRLILLQQQYARQLLIEHRNPYTGLPYAEDPTLALVELCDENGLFITAKRWSEMLSPYREELQVRWNAWLKDRYGDTRTLTEAWTDADAQRGLLPGEGLEQANVALFPPAVRPGALPSGDADPEAGQVGRVSDRRLFFSEVHRQYFTAMRDYLHNHGVTQPITAVTDYLHLSDLRTVAEALDFVGINFYYDHPSWAKGNDWRLPAYFENVNPIADPRLESFAPRVCASRVHGKPLVVREWNYCWPNKFRGPGLLEAATYGALQDLDALLLFTYDVKPGQRRVEFFDVRSDPARWGLAGQCAAIFLGRQVAPARREVAVGYSTTDTHYPTYQPFPTDLYRLGWVSRLSNLFFDEQPPPGPDLLVASGRTSGSVYPGQRAVICGNWPAMDLLDHRRDQATDQRSGYDVATVPEQVQDFAFGGTMYPAGVTQRLSAAPGYLLADVQHNPDYRPLGLGADGETCLGFRDMKRQNYVFRRLNAVQEMRVALDALGQLFDLPVSNEFADTRRWTSDTGQVKRLVDAELLVIDAPTAQGFAGSLQDAAQTRTGTLSLTTATSVGALVWLSLDGKPADSSRRWSLKMVSTAVNTGEAKTLHHTNAERTTFALTELGQAPISTLGEPGKTTTVTLAGKTLVTVGMANGVWEVLSDGTTYTVYCGTPGVRLSLPQLGESVTVTTVTAAGPGKPQRLSQPLTYPDGAYTLQITR